MTLALEALYIAVKSAIETEYSSDGIEVAFGWRQPSKSQVLTRRIVFVPGDPTGNAGRVGPARDPGRNPRPLATLHEQFHVVISANDPTAPEVEVAQYRIVRVLRDSVHRAMYRAARGTFAIEREQWDVDLQNERRFGAALVMQCTIQAMVPDSYVAVGVPVETEAHIETSELDVTETQIVSAADEP